jgi:two-component system, chemotaxis family, CheB/CheR fusion protein
VSSGDFPIVGIGASAGGIDAFHSFLENMPANCGMAFVMILHLPADRKSVLVDILSRWTTMPVVEATDGTRLEPDHVYIPPPHSLVSLNRGVLGVGQSPDNQERLFRPIDGFFDSLGASLRERAVGIVLSGTGSDGALGLKAIKECGGLTIAQGVNGSAPQYGEMPAGAIATGAVDIISPVEEMPGHLLRIHANGIDLKESAQLERTESARLAICTILREHLDHDFSEYRSQTFMRRVARRMQVLNLTDLDDYVAKLKADVNEVSALFRDLLIRVTSFFRDKEIFEALEANVIPVLFAGRKADQTVRIWVPGCATGEEAYSLAMLLREHMSKVNAPPKIQIFATDIDASAIATARIGRYPATLLEGLAPQRLNRFFTASQGGYCVSKEIRDLCTFSAHNLIRDPPFSMMSLVSCRNLLIYMNPELQSRIIPIFHYSLIPGGVLLLGGSESVAQHSGLFDTLDKGARIFQRREGRGPELDLKWHRSFSNQSDPRALEGSMASGQHDAVLGIRQAALTQRSDANPVNSPAARFKYLLGPMPVSEEAIAQLQRALTGICEELQSLTEEHQTALEELRSVNEELHSVNEEMQSTNEELETSKEELQSVNEELHTVNLRLTEKIDELDQANSDLRNLFESTEIATVFVDRHLVIRSFTPAIASLYNLIPSDQGRPLTDISTRLEYRSLREDVARVLQTLEPLERRVVRGDSAARFIMRILPYREPDSTVSGVLVTFVDVTNIVQAEEALVEADSRKDIFLATLSHELRNPLAPIRIAAQLLQSPELSRDDLAHAQAIISRQVAHMSSLLDDLLDVSRITRDDLLLKKQYVNVQVLMEDAVEAVRPAVDVRHHTLRVEYPAEPIWLEVDPVRITQVITNLLANAAKYTPNGGQVFLETRLEPQHFLIRVRDTGVGLAPVAMSKIFQMFTRIDTEVTRAEGGLGIGLALAKGLTLLHGGQLQVHSAGRGQGSEFTIRLPLSLIAAAPPTLNSAADSAGKVAVLRILIADDNRDAADSLSMLLRLSGHDIKIARSGGEALAIADQFRPDVGIIDIGMPDMDGYEVARRIRHEAWGETMTLIAVTGWGQADDKRRALAAGFDRHMTKPVDPEELERACRR